MRIVNVGYDYRHPTGFAIDRPRGTGDCILLILRTEAFFVFRGVRVIAPPCSAVLLKKGTPQLYGATNGDFVNDWIHFEIDSEEERAIEEAGIPFDTVIPLREVSELSDFVKSVFLERYSQNVHKEASMECYFRLILLKILDHTQGSTPFGEHPYYHAMCILRNDIRSAPGEDWSIEAIARRMRLSRSYVQHLYKHFFGKGIVADVQAGRIEHAKYLLSATDVTVGRVADACGYASDVHFMRVFKKETRLTPSQFREKYRVAPREVRISQRLNPYCLAEKSEQE